jgi:hypothetical protein
MSYEAILRDAIHVESPLFDPELPESERPHHRELTMPAAAHIPIQPSIFRSSRCHGVATYR